MMQEKDAVMPHGYGWKYSAAEEDTLLLQARRNNPKATIYDVSEPSEIGAYAVDSAVAIDAKNYVTAGNAFWKHLLTSSQIYAHAIKKRLPNASVINAGGARTTSLETRKLVKEAKKRGWKNLGTVAVGPHYERAALAARKIERKRSVKRSGIAIEVFAAEDVLSNSQKHGGGKDGARIAEEYKEKFKAIQESEPYRELEKHEKRAIFVEKLHLTRLVDVVSEVIRPRVMSK